MYQYIVPIAIIVIVLLVLYYFQYKDNFTDLISSVDHCKINCARCPRDYYCGKINVNKAPLNPENMTNSCYCIRHSTLDIDQDSIPLNYLN